MDTIPQNNNYLTNDGNALNINAPCKKSKHFKPAQIIHLLLSLPNFGSLFEMAFFLQLIVEAVGGKMKPKACVGE